MIKIPNSNKTEIHSGNIYSRLRIRLRNSIFIISILFAGFGVKAQTNLDSLYTVWQDESQTDSLRVHAFSKFITQGFISRNLDSALSLTNDLVQYAEEKNYPKALGSAYDGQSEVYRNRGNYVRALELAEKSLEVYQSEGALVEMEYVLSNIGHLNEQTGNLSNALEAFLQSQKINEELGNELGRAISLSQIAGIYSTLGEELRAIDYYMQGIEIYEELGKDESIPSQLHSIGNSYTHLSDTVKALEYYTKALQQNQKIGNEEGRAFQLGILGDFYRDLGRFELAEDYYNQSLALKIAMGDSIGLAESYYDLAHFYGAQERLDKALEYLKLCLKIHENRDNEFEIAFVLNEIGACYFDMGDYKNSLKYCEKGFAITKRLGALPEQHFACECLVETYSALGNPAKELEYFRILKEIEETFHLEESAQRLQEMEFEKLRLQDSIAKAEEARLVEESHDKEMQRGAQTRNIGFGVGFLFVLLAIGFYSRWRYVTKSKEALQVEKDRSENLLLNILPEEIAQELKEKGKADARNFDLVSILFTDFKDFTQASAKLSAKELVQEINTCFEAFDGILEKYGIEKIKTIGDAYMCAGGLPVPSDDSVKNTVLAALAMQEFISLRKSKMTEKGLPAFEMRVGIHTGPVVAGIVGVKKFQYDIWGDTVNTASRIESNGKVGKVNISQSTYELLKDDPEFVFESRGKIEAKGKGEIEMWFVGKHL